MAPEVDEALLSAYLDGEVTAEERRRVEQLLADSAAWRQFYDELRSLRAAFAALPRRQLDGAFTERVLREAERFGRAPGNGEALRVVRAPDRGAGRLRLPRHWRAWAWPAVAATAALLMMLHRPEQPARKLAEAPAERPLPANLEIGAAPTAKPAANADAPRLAEADDESAPAQAKRLESSFGASPAAPMPTDGVADSVGGRGLPPAAPRDAMEPPQSAAGADAPGPKAAPRQSAASSALPPPALSGDAMPAVQDNPMGAEASAASADSAKGSDGAKLPQAKPQSPAPALARRKGGPALRARGAGASLLDEPLAGEMASGERQQAGVPKDLLVVELVAQPQTAGHDVLQQLLARHGIAASAAPADQQASAKGERFADKTTPAPNAGSEKLLMSATGAMQCEASPEQIEAALADLRQSVDKFTSVRVLPASGSILQQPLAAYSRDAATTSPAPVKSAKTKPSRARSPARGGLGGFSRSAAPASSPDLSASPNPPISGDNKTATNRLSAEPAQAAKSATAPAAEDQRPNDRERLDRAEGGRSPPEAAEDQEAPLRALFVLRIAEPPFAEPPSNPAPGAK